MQQVSKSEFKARLQTQRQAPADAPSPSPSPTASSRAAPPPPPQPSQQQQQSAKELRYPSVADYRGKTAVANIKPAKNQADDASQTSLPCAVAFFPLKKPAAATR